MNKPLLNAWVIGACLICTQLGAAQSRTGDIYVIDPDHSTIAFRIKHLGITFF